MKNTRKIAHWPSTLSLDINTVQCQKGSYAYCSCLSSVVWGWCLQPITWFTSKVCAMQHGYWNRAIPSILCWEIWICLHTVFPFHSTNISWLYVINHNYKWVRYFAVCLTPICIVILDLAIINVLKDLGHIGSQIRYVPLCVHWNYGKNVERRFWKTQPVKK